MLFQVVEPEHLGKGFHVRDVDRTPGILVSVGLGVEVMTFGLQRRRVRVGGFDDPPDPGNARLWAA
ncbi:hypothetical protein D3C76_1807410 [compost metagenome]